MAHARTHTLRTAYPIRTHLFLGTVRWCALVMVVGLVIAGSAAFDGSSLLAQNAPTKVDAVKGETKTDPKPDGKVDGKTEEPRQPTKFKELPPEVEKPVNEEDQVRLDRELDWFKYVENDRPFAFRGAKIPDEKKELAANQELRAYNYTVAYAAGRSPELMAKYSMKKVNFSDLFKTIGTDYLRELLHFEGRLTIVQKLKATDELADSHGIKWLYEAWIIPDNHRDLMCVVISDLPDGVEPGENLSYRVALDAYYFKLWHYETREKRDDGRQNIRRAPLMIGKTIKVLGKIEPLESAYSGSMLATIVGALALLVLIAAGMGYWFRSGDRKIMAGSKRAVQDGVQFDAIPTSPELFADGGNGREPVRRD